MTVVEGGEKTVLGLALQGLTPKTLNMYAEICMYANTPNSSQITLSAPPCVTTSYAQYPTYMHIKEDRR